MIAINFYLSLSSKDVLLEWWCNLKTISQRFRNQANRPKFSKYIRVLKARSGRHKEKSWKNKVANAWKIRRNSLFIILNNMNDIFSNCIGISQIVIITEIVDYIVFHLRVEFTGKWNSSPTGGLKVAQSNHLKNDIYIANDELWPNWADLTAISSSKWSS